MKGDRVTVTNSMANMATDDILHVYKPRVDGNGQYIFAFDGSVVIDSAGGVKTGTTGTIQGEALKVHKTQLLHLAGQEGASVTGNSDFILVFPVYLDQYQQIGWFPAEHLKITAGGRA